MNNTDYTCKAYANLCNSLLLSFSAFSIVYLETFFQILSISSKAPSEEANLYNPPKAFFFKFYHRHRGLTFKYNQLTVIFTNHVECLLIRMKL